MPHFFLGVFCVFSFLWQKYPTEALQEKKGFFPLVVSEARCPMIGKAQAQLNSLGTMKSGGVTPYTLVNTEDSLEPEMGITFRAHLQWHQLCPTSLGLQNFQTSTSCGAKYLNTRTYGDTSHSNHSTDSQGFCYSNTCGSRLSFSAYLAWGLSHNPVSTWIRLWVEDTFYPLLLFPLCPSPELSQISYISNLATIY